MKNEKEPIAKSSKQKEPKQKPKGKVAQVYELRQKGASVKEIAQKMKLSERVVRSYIWRAGNPEKYKALLQRYFAKKKQKAENKAINAAVKNNNKNSKKRNGKKTEITA